jgi:hypothetical protein
MLGYGGLVSFSGWPDREPLFCLESNVVHMRSGHCSDRRGTYYSSIIAQAIDSGIPLNSSFAGYQTAALKRL